MKIQRFKEIICLLALIFITYSISFAQQTNFSGKWLLSEQKSDFKEQSPDVVFKQIVVEQTKTELKVAGTSFTQVSGQSPKTIVYPLSGSSLTTVLSNKRTMTASVISQRDGKTLIRNSSYSLPDQPVTKDYSSKETWSLSSDAKELHLTREFTVDDGNIITILAVYDKQ